MGSSFWTPPVLMNNFKNQTFNMMDGFRVSSSDGSLSLVSLIAMVGLISLIVWYFRSKDSVLARLPGPPSQSLLLGNQLEYEVSDVGDKDLEWLNKYGRTFRFKGGWGEDVLFTSDPKAMQFVLQVSAYNFHKGGADILRTKMLFGESILGCDGDDHKRHRRAMNPAFALPETKNLTPVFQAAGRSMVTRWSDELAQSSNQRIVTNVHTLLAKATLDAIGEAAFGTKFGAVKEVEHPLAKNFNNLIIRVFGGASPLNVAYMNTMAAAPLLLTKVLFSIPSSMRRSMKESHDATFKLGKELLREKEKESGDVESLGGGGKGGGKKDLLSLLVKSNNSEKESTRLSEEDMLGAMSAVMLAGHETTATTTTYALWELAKQPLIQAKLRAEIRKFYKEATEGGEECIHVREYEKMEFTQAVLKETLRYTPLVPLQTRAAFKDIVVPLSEPATLKDGSILREVPLKKGTRVILSVVQYNRHEEIWGKDARVFNPERWLDGRVSNEVKYGAFANLGTFGAGVHACIGWRFAVYELQSVLIELINNFKFELTPEARELRMAYARVSVPVRKENARETYMPLVVSRAD